MNRFVRSRITGAAVTLTTGLLFMAASQDRRLPSSPAPGAGKRLALAVGNDAYVGLARSGMPRTTRAPCAML